MDAIELLVNEHGLIRQYLDNLSVAAEKLESGERPSEVFFKKAVEFAKKFTDKFHHFKEEHVLFTQLAQKKGGAFDGQIDSLRHQHEHSRNFITEITNSLDGYAKGYDIHTTILIENLAAYISLLRHHIHTEDHNFYQIVKQEFSESELEGFVELFDQEKIRIGGEPYENSRDIVQEMSTLL